MAVTALSTGLLTPKIASLAARVVGCPGEEGTKVLPYQAPRIGCESLEAEGNPRDQISRQQATPGREAACRLERQEAAVLQNSDFQKQLMMDAGRASFPQFTISKQKSPLETGCVLCWPPQPCQAPEPLQKGQHLPRGLDEVGAGLEHFSPHSPTRLHLHVALAPLLPSSSFPLERCLTHSHMSVCFAPRPSGVLKHLLS